MVVALQICSCMLSDPVHLDPPSPKSLNPTPFQKLVEPRSPVDVLASPCTSVSHPAPISKCLVNLCLILFCTALCVYHMHSVDTLLRSSYLPFSHLHCLSLRPEFNPFSPLYSLCYKKTGTCPIFFSPRLPYPTKLC